MANISLIIVLENEQMHGNTKVINQNVDCIDLKANSTSSKDVQEAVQQAITTVRKNFPSSKIAVISHTILPD